MIDPFKKRIEKFLSYMPPIPAVLMELIQVLKDDDIDLKKLGRLIEKDPSMSMNVLKVANSALYNLPNKVTDISHAVRMLGTREITMICISCGTGKVLKPPRGLPTIDMDLFWGHSVATGIMAAILCRHLRLGTNADLYLAGLLHDTGAVILDQFLPDEYRVVFHTARRDGLTVVEAEKEIFGESHGAVGGWLMEKWQLPDLLICIAKSHHDPGSAPEEYRVQACLVALADGLTELKGYGMGLGDRWDDLRESQAYKVLREHLPGLDRLDHEDFLMEIENIGTEIGEMKKLVSGNGH